MPAAATAVHSTATTMPPNDVASNHCQPCAAAAGTGSGRAANAAISTGPMIATAAAASRQAGSSGPGLSEPSLRRMPLLIRSAASPGSGQRLPGPAAAHRDGQHFLAVRSAIAAWVAGEQPPVPLLEDLFLSASAHARPPSGFITGSVAVA